jgi:hypothetical protein
MRMRGENPLGSRRRPKMLHVSKTVVAATLLFLFYSVDPPSAHSGSGERHLVLANNTGQTIVEVYVADDDRTGNWQEDVLESGFLLQEKSVLVDIHEDHNGNCMVEVEAVLDDGSSRVLHHLNACYEHHAFSIR